MLDCALDKEILKLKRRQSFNKGQLRDFRVIIHTNIKKWLKTAVYIAQLNAFAGGRKSFRFFPLEVTSIYLTSCRRNPPKSNFRVKIQGVLAKRCLHHIGKLSSEDIEHQQDHMTVGTWYFAFLIRSCSVRVRVAHLTLLFHIKLNTDLTWSIFLFYVMIPIMLNNNG